MQHTTGSQSAIPLVFVWAVWAVQFVLAMTFVWNFASCIPRWDDWGLIPYVTNASAVDASYLWEQHNEHRFPLTKLIFVALGKVTRGDFRSGPIVNVI